MILELVLAVILESVESVAVTVFVPPVFNVTEKFLVPEDNAAFEGSVALVSEDVIAMVSVALVITFQPSSTAFTVTLKEVPAV